MQMARLQLELSDTYEALLERLQTISDLKTKKDVIENGLMLLGWATTEVSRGATIAAVDESNKVYKEVHTPALEGAKNFGLKSRQNDEEAAPQSSRGRLASQS